MKKGKISHIKWAIKYTLKDLMGVDIYAFEIHDISVSKKFFDKNIYIRIKLGRPGLFIGRGGVQCNDFIKRLESVLNCPVKIFLEEHDPFYQSY